jgi:hypothetical protein
MSKPSATNINAYRTGSNNGGISETGAIILGSVLGGLFFLFCITYCIYGLYGLYNRFCNKVEINRRKEIAEQKEKYIKERLEEQIRYTAEIRNISIDEARKLDKISLHPIELVPISTRNRENNNIDTVIEIQEITDIINKRNIEEDKKRQQLGLNPIICPPSYNSSTYNTTIVMDNNEIIKEETIV